MAVDGPVISASPNDPKETMDRFEAAVSRRGVVAYARFDHAAAAAQKGLDLRQTEVIVFTIRAAAHR